MRGVEQPFLGELLGPQAIGDRPHEVAHDGESSKRRNAVARHRVLLTKRRGPDLVSSEQVRERRHHLGELDAGRINTDRLKVAGQVQHAFHIWPVRNGRCGFSLGEARSLHLYRGRAGCSVFVQSGEFVVTPRLPRNRFLTIDQAKSVFLFLLGAKPVALRLVPPLYRTKLGQFRSLAFGCSPRSDHLDTCQAGTFDELMRPVGRVRLIS